MTERHYTWHTLGDSQTDYQKLRNLIEAAESALSYVDDGCPSGRRAFWNLREAIEEIEKDIICKEK